MVINMSSYENYFTEILKKEKIKFVREKTFKDLKKGLYRFDFYLPNYNGEPIIVEIDGEQHFKPIYGRAALLKTQEHDRQKNMYCLANKITLYRIPYWELKNVHSIFDAMNDIFLVKTKWHSDLLKVPK